MHSHLDELTVSWNIESIKWIGNVEAVPDIAALAGTALASFSKLVRAQVIVSAINWGMMLRGL